MSVDTGRKVAEAEPSPAGDENRPAVGEGEGVPTLDLADLIQDDNGEIVLFNDSHLPVLALRTDAAAVSRGEVGAHTTASGEDVSGFSYVSFSNGLTVFFKGTDLIVVDGGDA
ncbi:MAG: hypothetical protein KDG89_15045 [Geminicoccaceae bacterium]|nr:hypothetical protein [Geminicoccaceae bacterium]